METKQNMSTQLGEHSPEWIKSLEHTGMAVAESLSQIVSTVEAVAQSVSKFFDTLKRQKNTVMEFGHHAGEKIRPVTETGLKVLSTSRDLGNRMIKKSRENPTPFVIGGIAILGGLTLLAYYLKREEESRTETERDIFDTRIAS